MSEVKTFVAGHKSPDTDSICSAISYANLLTQMGTPATPVCAGDANKETKYALEHFGFEHTQIVTNWEEFAPNGGDLYLTDHNESKQIIDGYKSMNMCGVIDHHRIGDFETDGPVFIRMEPVGCTNTILTKLYIENNQEIPKNIAGLMLSAIISDTVLFRSPTCTETDKEMAHKLAAIAGVDIDSYGLDMLKAGADISDLTNDEIVRTDMKEFSEAGQTISIGQISVMDTTDVLAKQAELVAALEALRTTNGYAASYIMVTNILDESTTLIYSGDVESVVVNAFGKDVKDNAVFLPNTMSRKKQIVPPILGAMK
ncbi:manganese-dependent inorganic pyrophosphatase [uncultured Veillonella sp.]|uniref:manganese-dependent inorganic pyrophosphatase n=1 Tax=uncultured Veillonella sp. TaxID=159268 RepID=UPI00266D9521|nr:manganese-dependent inorganic pyrophosphatase [uncultured Veillonella sp.]